MNCHDEQRCPLVFKRRLLTIRVSRRPGSTLLGGAVPRRVQMAAVLPPAIRSTEQIVLPAQSDGAKSAPGRPAIDFKWAHHRSAPIPNLRSIRSLAQPHFSGSERRVPWHGQEDKDNSRQEARGRLGRSSRRAACSWAREARRRVRTASRWASG